MKPVKFSILILFIIILSTALVGCGNNEATPAPVENQGTTTEAPSTSATQGVESTESKPAGVPEDVPVMPDAYELQVPNQLNVSYKVNATIQEVAAFYQEELPNYGWTVITNPDSVVGSMAQISRSNEAGDRLIFSIQYNSIGEFTVIQIYITRAP